MGIWLELGVFVLVLLFGIWQIRDAKQAHAKTVAERKAREAQAASQAAPKARD
jgi:heme exporter protein D